MGTKLNPGKFDCYSRAANDEPMFTLLARDWTSDGLVEIWTMLRTGNFLEAYKVLGSMIDKAPFDFNPASEETIAQITEAKDCSEAMRVWREGE